MFHLALVIITQHIKPQTICLYINNLLQFMLNLPKLCCIQNAFKDRVLNPLSIIHTLLGYLTQPLSPFRRLSIHVIRYQY